MNIVSVIRSDALLRKPRTASCQRMPVDEGSCPSRSKSIICRLQRDCAAAVSSTHDECSISAKLWYSTESQQKNVCVLCVDVDIVPRSCNFHSMEDHERVGFLLSALIGSNVTVVVHHHALACDSHDVHRTV